MLTFERKERMKIDQKLIDATVAFMNERYGSDKNETIVAGAYLENGQILFGICTDAPLSAACLCAETGTICEAQRLNLRLTASVCIIRENAGDAIKFLTPCGLCQERLRFFGKETSIAVPRDGDATVWIPISLGELQPNYWHNVFDKAS